MGIFIFLIYTGRLVYGTNDDATMAAIAGGGYGGSPSPYIVNIHYLLGVILKELYVHLGSINWLTVLYFVIYGISFWIIDSNLADRCLDIYDSITVVCITGLSFYMMLSFFSFTVAAYTLLTAGVMCLWNRGMRTLTVVCFILAAMMRCDVLNTAIAVLTVYEIIYMAWLREDLGRTKKEICSITVIAVIKWLSAATNTLLLSRDATERSFYEWGELRSRALDCVQVPYEEALFNAYGFSKAAYNACYGAFYYIHEAVDSEKMKLLIEWNRNRYHLHIIGYIEAHVGAYCSPDYRGVWQGMFIAVIILNLISCGRRRRIRTIALYAGVVAADYAYYVIQRPLLHVMMPTYVMGSLLGLLIYAGQDKLQTAMRRMPAVLISMIVTIVSVSAIGCSPNKYSMVMTADETDSLHIAREYIEEHQDKLYFALDPGVFAMSVDEDIWHNRYRENRYNLAGNWEIYSLPANDMFERYGIDCTDPGREAPDNEKIVFLHSQPEEFDPDDNYIIDLYREYYDEDVRFEAVDDLSNGWGAFILRR